MNQRPWRERVAAEDTVQRQLLDDMAQSARRRALALREGVAELGSKAAVARELGIDEKAVRRAIAALDSAATGSPTE